MIKETKEKNRDARRMENIFFDFQHHLGALLSIDITGRNEKSKSYQIDHRTLRLSEDIQSATRWFSAYLFHSDTTIDWIGHHLDIQFPTYLHTYIYKCKHQKIPERKPKRHGKQWHEEHFRVWVFFPQRRTSIAWAIIVATRNFPDISRGNDRGKSERFWMRLNKWATTGRRLSARNASYDSSSNELDKNFAIFAGDFPKTQKSTTKDRIQ